MGKQNFEEVADKANGMALNQQEHGATAVEIQLEAGDVKVQVKSWQGAYSPRATCPGADQR